MESPGRLLMAAILRQALVDISAPKPWERDRGHRATAVAWVLADDQAWGASFVNVCQVLGLEPESVRKYLRDQLG